MFSLTLSSVKFGITLKNIFIIYISLLLGIVSIGTACKKPLIFSNGNLAFSKDTVVFDTVFTTIGSTTQQLKIYNKENRTVVIQEVELMGGSNSPFRINLDGISSTNFNEIELEGKDSLYCFVEVTLNPNGGNLPMVIEDRIRFRTNGKDQYVILVAWGQDMYYHYSDIASNNLDTNEGIWPNDKPHLIYGGAFIDSAKQLIIQQNTHIFLHKNAFLFNYKGTLIIDGTKDQPVLIQGDRLETDYDDVSGQYYGVYFKEALASTINYAEIKNGTAGIHIEGNGNNGSTPTLTIRNSKIYNHASYGILNFNGGKIKAENCIVAQNGYYAFFNLAGESYDLLHCNLLGYNSGDQQTPAVAITDYYQSTGYSVTGTIRNSVIYGNLDGEIVFDTFGGGNNFAVDNCLIKRTPIGTAPIFINNIWNQDPAFKNIVMRDFKVWSTSPMINAANPAYQTQGNLDINGISRGVTPDIGAYEN